MHKRTIKCLVSCILIKSYDISVEHSTLLHDTDRITSFRSHFNMSNDCSLVFHNRFPFKDTMKLTTPEYNLFPMAGRIYPNLGAEEGIHRIHYDTSNTFQLLSNGMQESTSLHSNNKR